MKYVANEYMKFQQIFIILLCNKFIVSKTLILFWKYSLETITKRNNNISNRLCINKWTQDKYKTHVVLRHKRTLHFIISMCVCVWCAFFPVLLLSHLLISFYLLLKRQAVVLLRTLHIHHVHNILSLLI